MTGIIEHPDKPFFFGRVADDETFFDREAEQKSLRFDFMHGQNVILLSPRRFGKTSLVKHVLRSLPSKTHLTVFIDLFKVSSKHRLLNVYTKAISASLNTRLEAMVHQVREWIPAFSPKITISPDQGAEFELEFAEHKVDLDDLIEKIFELPQTLAKKRGKKVVVVLDEFQDILQLQAPHLLKLLRAVIQHQRDVSYCFMGSKRHLLEDMFLNAKNPLYQSGKIMNLQKIPHGHLTTFVTRQFASQRISISPELCERMVSLCHDHIYYVQMLGYETWQGCVGHKKVDAGAIDEASDRILRNQGAYFEMLWDNLTAKQKNLLLALLGEGHSRLQNSAIIQRYELGSSTAVSKNLKALTASELLDKTGKDITFANPFFPLWLRREIV